MHLNLESAQSNVSPSKQGMHQKMELGGLEVSMGESVSEQWVAVKVEDMAVCYYGVYKHHTCNYTKFIFSYLKNITLAYYNIFI